MKYENCERIETKNSVSRECPKSTAHDGGNTFAVIKASIEQEGYDFSSAILSPHEFGTPQIRKRLYMVAIEKEYCQSETFQFPQGTKQKTSVKTILDKKSSVDKKYYLSDEEIRILNHWNKFIQQINPEVKPPSPTWSQDFAESFIRWKKYILFLNSGGQL